jgi:hypothetical protein
MLALEFKTLLLCPSPCFLVIGINELEEQLRVSARNLVEWTDIDIKLVCDQIQHRRLAILQSIPVSQGVEHWLGTPAKELW